MDPNCHAGRKMSVENTGKTTAKENLTLKIYNGLLQKFLTNELVPGTVIDRRAIAEEYQVSMAPVRDALQRLTLEGFIETRSRSATIVKAIQREDIYGTLTMREALESQVARMVCGEKIRAGQDALMESARWVDEAEDIMSYWQADVRFHCQLVELSGCKLLINTYNQIMNVGNFYQINSFFMNKDPQNRDSHIELVQKLTTDDPDQAEMILRRHLQSGKTNLF